MMRMGRSPLAAFADSVPPPKLSKLKGVQPTLGRIATQCRQKLLDIERLRKNRIRAAGKTCFFHLIGCGAADYQHLGSRKAALDVLQYPQADFRRVQYGRQMQ